MRKEDEKEESNATLRGRDIDLRWEECGWSRRTVSRLVDGHSSLVIPDLIESIGVVIKLSKGLFG